MMKGRTVDIDGYAGRLKHGWIVQMNKKEIIYESLRIFITKKYF